jgi:hypothetical protein
MHPEPVCGIASHGRLKRSVDVQRNSLHGTRPTVIARWDFVADFDTPPAQSHAIANRGVERSLITQREHGRGGAGGTVVPEKREPQTAIARVLIGEQSQQESGVAHHRAQRGCVGSTLKETTTRSLADRLHEPIQRGVLQSAIRGGALKSRDMNTQACEHFKISKMAERYDATLWSLVRLERRNLLRTEDLDPQSERRSA